MCLDCSYCCGGEALNNLIKVGVCKYFSEKSVGTWGSIQQSIKLP